MVSPQNHVSIKGKYNLKMFNDESYSIYLSISEHGFPSKEEAVNALPYYIDKTNKVKNPNLCTFSKQKVTVSELANYITSGHTCCAVFDSSCFSAGRKKDEHFRYTQAIFYDIDHADCEMTTLLDSVPYEPTIAYKTFSDREDDHRFRFVYVLEDYVNKYDFDFVYGKMAEVCSLDIPALDRRSKEQCYFGTLNTDAVVTGTVYSLADFGIELPRFQQGVIIVEGMRVRTHSEMIASASGHYFLYPEVYYEVFHYYTYNPDKHRGEIRKMKNGEHRRLSLWKKGQIYMLLNQWLTKDGLFKVLKYELENFYENTEDIIPLEGKRSIRAISDSAFEKWKDYPIRQSEHGTFKINVEYWKDFMNRGNGKYIPIVAVAKCRAEITRDKIAALFRPELSDKENKAILNEAGIKVCEKTIRRYREDNLGMESPKKMELNRLLVEYIELKHANPSMTTKELSERLGVSLSKVKRLSAKINKEKNSKDVKHYDITTDYKGKVHWTCKVLLPDNELEHYRLRKPNDNGNYPLYFEDIETIMKYDTNRAKAFVLDASMILGDRFFITIDAA